MRALRHATRTTRMASLSESEKPNWFGDGLSFSCTQCGACCSGSPGSVRFSGEEMHTMASKLGISPEHFQEKYARVETQGEEFRWLELKEVPTPAVEQPDGTLLQSGGLDCIFLDRKTVPGKAICGVYDARPMQCKTWPFWEEIVEDEESWNEAASGVEGCPGLGKGKKYSADEIAQSVWDTGYYRHMLDHEAMAESDHHHDPDHHHDHH